jgi:hypothetical protein
MVWYGGYYHTNNNNEYISYIADTPQARSKKKYVRSKKQEEEDK